MRRVAQLASMLVLASLACDRASEPAQNPEPAPAQPESTPAPSQPEAWLTLPEIPAESTERTPEQVRELHQRYRTLLREARAKREANQLDAALVDYRALLEIDPTDPTALGELAEIALALTHFDLAEAALNRAIRYARDDAAKQHLMIQLGGVAEAQGKLEGAATQYRAALSLREDADLRARLNRFEIACPPDPANARGCRGLPTLGEAFNTLMQACRRAVEVTSGCDRDGDCDELDDDALAELCDPPSEEGGGALVYTYDEGYHYVFPVVRTPLGWTVFASIADVINPGINGMTAEYEVSDSLHKVSGPPKHTYHVIDYDYANRDINMGEGTDAVEAERGVVLCRVDGLRALCTEAFVYFTEASLQLDSGKYEYNDVLDGEYELKGSTIVIRRHKRAAEKHVIEDALTRGSL